MKDQEKPKETLIRELNELRQRVKRLESKLSEVEYERRGYNTDTGSNTLSREQVWRLPGYWH